MAYHWVVLKIFVLAVGISSSEQGETSCMGWKEYKDIIACFLS